MNRAGIRSERTQRRWHDVSFGRSAFTSIAKQPGGSALLTGTGPANSGYRLWASTDLLVPFASWILLTSDSFDCNGNFSYTDVGAAPNPSRFYQLSVP